MSPSPPSLPSSDGEGKAPLLWALIEELFTNGLDRLGNKEGVPVYLDGDKDPEGRGLDEGGGNNRLCRPSGLGKELFPSLPC